MAPLHLALVGPWPPYRGGIAQFGARLARALRQRGHVVHPITFCRQYPERLFPGETQLEPGGRPDDLPQGPRLLDSLNPKSWWTVGRYLRELRPNAVVFQHWMPFFAPAYGTVARRCVAADGTHPARLALVHNALPHERRPGDLALSRYFLRACDGAVALSASVRQDLTRLAPGLRLEQAGHPIYDQFGPATDRDEARRRLGLAADAPALLFFGFVRHYKGLDILIEAMPAIRARQPGATLLVAGEFYDDPAPYRQRVRELGLEDAVRFESRYLPAEEVPVFFGAADVVVQPYRAATQSGVALAAFGFGVPVVTTNVGGLAEAVPHGEAGLVVPPENPPRLASAVLAVLEDAPLAARLRAGAARQRDERGWGILCQTIERLTEA